MKPLKSLLVLGLLALTLPVAGQKTFKMDLWEGNMPHATGGKDIPDLHVFLPSGQTATGRAIVICPGGGYEHLAFTHEGCDWAPFLNNLGIAAIVLRYRMPHEVTMAPLSDAEEAIRVVRRHAEEWHINPADVGIMGFSAGGHLASTIATHATDEAKPDFQVLFYPVITMDPEFTHLGSRQNLLGQHPTKSQETLYSNEKQVNGQTPRAFIALSNDDDCVPPVNSIEYYSALLANKVPAAMYVWPTGGHGYGINATFKYHHEMLSELRSWLKSF
ncbi:MAG: alpha/beta hydrolase [Prevotella sp.]